MFGRKKKLRNQKNYLKYRNQSFYSASKREKNQSSFNVYLFIKRFLFIFLLLLLVYVLFFSPLFLISEVIIEGNHRISRDDLKQTIERHQNIFRFNLTAKEKEIKNDFPVIKQLEIYRGLPNALKIVVLEREEKIIWQTKDQKYYIDDDGFVISVVDDAPSSKKLPLIIDKKEVPLILGQKVASGNFIAFVNNIYNNFYETTNIQPLHFEIVETTFDINLYTEAGFYVKLNSLRGSQKQLQSLKTVLVEKREEIKEYIDLRIDGWAYYK